jgi:hypothetical protein
MLDILDHYAAYRLVSFIHHRNASNPFSPHQPEGLESRFVLAGLSIFGHLEEEEQIFATGKQDQNSSDLDDLAEPHDREADLG